MSYSFSAQGATKDDVKASVDTQLAKVVAGQPVHSVDTASVRALVHAFVDSLVDDVKHGFHVTVSGAISHKYGTSPPEIVHANVNVTAQHASAK